MCLLGPVVVEVVGTAFVAVIQLNLILVRHISCLESDIWPRNLIRLVLFQRLIIGWLIILDGWLLLCDVVLQTLCLLHILNLILHLWSVNWRLLVILLTELLWLHLDALTNFLYKVPYKRLLSSVIYGLTICRHAELLHLISIILVTFVLWLGWRRLLGRLLLELLRKGLLLLLIVDLVLIELNIPNNWRILSLQYLLEIGQLLSLSRLRKHFGDRLRDWRDVNVLGELHRELVVL